MTPIPKTIHQIWLGPRPLPEWTHDWRRAYTALGWNYEMWTDEHVRRYRWRLASVMKQQKQYCAIADMLRIQILVDCGGVYVDADAEFIAPLPQHLLENEMFAFWENERARPGLIQTGVIGARPGAPLLKHMIAAIETAEAEAKPSYRNAKVFEKYGPGRFTSSFAECGWSGLTIYPSHMVAPHHWTGTTTRQTSATVYAIQHWATTLGKYKEPHE